MPDPVPETTVDRLRVAAAQFACGGDPANNLAKCLQLIDTAAAKKADLIVLPEFCNHISVYNDAAHCREVAVTPEGEWLTALAQRTAKHRLYVALAVTMLHNDNRVTVTNALFDPSGNLVATADKQMLMGNERAFLSPGSEPRGPVPTKFGPVGLYACMDGVTFEMPRALAVQGARLLINSLNSFARDEATLHIPVRAAENGVFVVAANKVGPLVPAKDAEAFSTVLGVDPEALNGAGDSQIVSPDGTVLAIAPRSGEALVVSDIDLSQTVPQRLKNRRPTLYGPLTQAQTATPVDTISSEVKVACVSGARTKPELVQTAIASGASLLVLPELSEPPQMIPAGVFVVTSAMQSADNGTVCHVGQVWTAAGLVHEQPQLHFSDRYRQVSEFASSLRLCETPFGDVAVLVGDDHRYPEAFRLAAIAGAHLVAVCWQPEFAWETGLALRERSAENRLAVAACAPTGCLGAAVMFDPPADSLWNASRSSAFDGTINNPEMFEASPNDRLLVASLHPLRATNRQISKDTDLVAGRPWRGCGALSAPTKR